MKLTAILLILATLVANANANADPSEYEEILRNREKLNQIGQASLNHHHNTSIPIKQGIEAGALAYSVSNIQNPNALTVAGALSSHLPGTLSQSLSKMGWR